METFIYIVMAIVVAFNVGITIWFMVQINKSDELHKKAIDEIYEGKR